jgi:hypothetical protein
MLHETRNAPPTLEPRIRPPRLIARNGVNGNSELHLMALQARFSAEEIAA